MQGFEYISFHSKAVVKGKTCFFSLLSHKMKNMEPFDQVKSP